MIDILVQKRFVAVRWLIKFNSADGDLKTPFLHIIVILTQNFIQIHLSVRKLQLEKNDLIVQFLLLSG